MKHHTDPSHPRNFYSNSAAMKAHHVPLSAPPLAPSRRLLAVGVAACMAGTLAACGGGGSGESASEDAPLDANISSTLYGKLAANPNLSICKAIVDKAGFKEQLSALGKQAITLLAPTNAAMQAYLAANPAIEGYLNAPLILPEQLSQLKQLVGYHLVQGDMSTDGLPDLGSFVSTHGSVAYGGLVKSRMMSLYVYKDNDGAGDTIYFNGVSSITSTDIVASNGRMHVLDTVLPLPTLIMFLNLQFSRHANGIAAMNGGLNANLLSAVNPAGFPYTVFAPTNNAWGSVVDGTLSQQTAGTLATAMQASIVSGAAHLHSDLIDFAATLPQEVVNLNGESISTLTTMVAGQTQVLLNTPYGIANGINYAPVSQADIFAINGVLHGLSSYLPVLIDDFAAAGS